jgi:hypothetical protein
VSAEYEAASGQFSGSDLDRFWSKVEPTGSCWFWTGPKDSHGYGCFKVAGKNLGAHRCAYRILAGVIPRGLQIDHLCRIRMCVNPDHMELVTAVENTRRGFNPAAMNARKTHCSRGHAFDEGNTRLLPQGSRACRTCKNGANRAYKARRREMARAAS